MLKFDLVKFEAQDVITASGVACAHTNAKLEVGFGNGMSIKATCNACGATGTGTEVDANGQPVIVWNK